MTTDTKMCHHMPVPRSFLWGPRGHSDTAVPPKHLLLHACGSNPYITKKGDSLDCISSPAPNDAYSLPTLNNNNLARKHQSTTLSCRHVPGYHRSKLKPSTRTCPCQLAPPGLRQAVREWTPRTAPRTARHARDRAHGCWSSGCAARSGSAWTWSCPPSGTPRPFPTILGYRDEQRIHARQQREGPMTRNKRNKRNKRNRKGRVSAKQGCCFRCGS